MDKIRPWLISSSPLASSSLPYHQTAARYTKCYFARGWSTFLMQPTSGGPSGPSVAQNYYVFTAKVGLRSQKPSPFQGVAEAPQEAPKRPSRGRQDKKLPRDPPGTPPGPSTEAPRWPHLSPQWPSTRPCKDPRCLDDQEFNQIFQTRSTPQGSPSPASYPDRDYVGSS